MVLVTVRDVTCVDLRGLADLELAARDNPRRSDGRREIHESIEKLVAEEHELWERESAGDSSDADRNARLS